MTVEELQAIAVVASIAAAIAAFLAFVANILIIREMKKDRRAEHIRVQIEELYSKIVLAKDDLVSNYDVIDNRERHNQVCQLLVSYGYLAEDTLYSAIKSYLNEPTKTIPYDRGPYPVLGEHVIVGVPWNSSELGGVVWETAYREREELREKLEEITLSRRRWFAGLRRKKKGKG